MSRQAAIRAAVAAMLFTGCGKSDSSSLVVVTVTAAPAMPEVRQLRAVVSNSGSSDTRMFPPVPSAAAIVFDTTFAVSLPKSRGGVLAIAVEALDSASQVVAAGNGEGDIVIGGRADAIVLLALVGVGAPDAGAGADVKNDVATTPADALQTVADARDLAGTVGTGGATGTGGSFATGGASGAGGAGTGGVAGTGGSKGTGGATGAGGVAGTGGAGARDGGAGGALGTGGITTTTTVYTGRDGGAGGVTGTGGVTGAGGTTGTTTGAEPCVPAKTVTGGMSGYFGTTGAYCFRTPDRISGWNCSNIDGRTLKVNGVTETCGALPLPAKVNGYYYFDVSAGVYDYASIYWY